MRYWGEVNWGLGVSQTRFGMNDGLVIVYKRRVTVLGGSRRGASALPQEELPSSL